MISLLLWAGIAQADPVAAVHGFEASGAGDLDVAVAVGGGGTVGYRWRRLQAELTGDLGVGLDGGVLAVVHPQGRLFFGPLERSRVSAVVGTGAVFEGSAAWAGMGGFAYDIGAGPWRPRIQALYLDGPQTPARLQVSLQLAFDRNEPEPEPVPEPVPVTEVEVPQGSSMVWVARPTCEWLPADEAAPLLQSRLDDVPVATLSNPWADPDDAEGHVLTKRPEPQSGDLVIVALPGDLVWIDDVAAEVAVNGLATASMPEGRVEIRVVGAGRDLSTAVGLTNGATVWLQLDDEPTLTHWVAFQRGRTLLVPEALQVVEGLGRALGSWRVKVRGGYSADGSLERNVEIAKGRAEVVRLALINAGVPEDRVSLEDPVAPDPDMTPDEQRSTRLVLVPAKEAP